MFPADRWAEAYLAACGKDGEDPSFGLAFLQTVLPFAAKVSAVVPGSRSADMFTARLKRAAEETGITGVRAGIALTHLFMRRAGGGDDAQKHVRLTEAVARLIDKRRGVLRVTLESAVPGIDERFRHDLEAALTKKHGAKTILFETKVNPALLGGYRWLVEGERTDCSLVSGLSRLEQTLKTAR